MSSEPDDSHSQASQEHDVHTRTIPGSNTYHGSILKIIHPPGPIAHKPPELRSGDISRRHYDYQSLAPNSESGCSSASSAQATNTVASEDSFAGSKEKSQSPLIAKKYSADYRKKLNESPKTLESSLRSLSLASAEIQTRLTAVTIEMSNLVQSDEWAVMTSEEATSQEDGPRGWLKQLSEYEKQPPPQFYPESISKRRARKSRTPSPLNSHKIADLTEEGERIRSANRDAQRRARQRKYNKRNGWEEKIIRVYSTASHEATLVDMYQTTCNSIREYIGRPIVEYADLPDLDDGL